MGKFLILDAVPKRYTELMDIILFLLLSRISENICTQTQSFGQVEQMDQNGESE